MATRMTTIIGTQPRQAALVAAVCALAIGCGGSQKVKSGLGEGEKPPPPPSLTGGSGKKTERKISKDARKDYMDAVAFFKKQEAAGWSSGACQSAADKFASVASDHAKLVEARYMAGLSYHRCNMAKEAEKEYQLALQVDRAHARSLSNLGELYFQAGKVDSAKKYWESALKADSKIVAAHNNLAWLLIQELRQTKVRSGAWKSLQEKARDHLSSSLAVNNDVAKTYVLYGLLYLEGSERNKSQLDLAKLLLDEGAKRDEKYAPLYNARGLLYMKRQNQGLALSNFEKAVELDGDFAEARMNVGNITLGFRKYDTAAEQFKKVLQLDPDNYDAIVGLGIAQRGLGNLDDAEASYNKAIKVDKNRGAAYFNLGVLYKDFRANSASDIKKSQEAYKTARKYFQSFQSKPDASEDDKKEAKANISDCDKIIKQLDDVIRQMSAQPAAG